MKSKKNEKKLFNPETKALIKDIAQHYIEIHKIVRKMCPKTFNRDEINMMFIKTEALYNHIQIENMNKNKKNNHKKSQSKVDDRNLESYI